jgi:hypothetical protein
VYNLKARVLVPNTPSSLQTTLAAEAQLAEGQFLLEEWTFSIKKYDIPTRHWKTTAFQKRRTLCKISVNLNMKEMMMMIIIIIIIIIIITIGL